LAGVNGTGFDTYKAKNVEINDKTFGKDHRGNVCIAIGLRITLELYKFSMFCDVQIWFKL